MNDLLLAKLNELKEVVSSSDEMKTLHKVEEEMSNDEEVMKLAYQKDVLSSKYEDALRHFGENSKEAKEAQKALYQAKLELDSHPLVKKYNEAYKKARKYYDLINATLFEEFNK